MGTIRPLGGRTQLLTCAVGLLVSSWAHSCCSAERRELFEVTLRGDILVAEVNGVQLLADLHLPIGAECPPLVMFIHGGGWRNGDRKACRLAWIAEGGYAVASVEYRLSDEARFPAQIHDCKGALRWLRAHQSEYGFDARRVVVAGTSAGGHLAALLGTSGGVAVLEGATAGHTDRSSRVQGVIDYYGATDFILRSKNQPAKTEEETGSVYQLLGGKVSEQPQLARLASPVTHVGAGDPPLLMVHGERDKTVYLTQSQRLLEAYRQHDLEAELRVEADRGHAWKTPSDGEREQVLQFLEKHLRRE